MKYLYKGMAMPGTGEVSGSVLLGWHEKVIHCIRFAVFQYANHMLLQVTEVAGTGCIVRVMTDRRTV